MKFEFLKAVQLTLLWLILMAIITIAEKSCEIQEDLYKIHLDLQEVAHKE